MVEYENQRECEARFSGKHGSSGMCMVFFPSTFVSTSDRTLSIEYTWLKAVTWTVGWDRSTRLREIHRTYVCVPSFLSFPLINRLIELHRLFYFNVSSEYIITLLVLKFETVFMIIVSWNMADK